jgi:serine/threonine protein phosphatase PrpC
MAATLRDLCPSQETAMHLTLRFTVRSDVGLIREVNEDSVHAAPHLLVVADGMGGHAGGEVASSAVVSHVAQVGPVTWQNGPADELRSAILAGNAAIARAVHASPELDGMGTTLTAVLLVADSDRFVVANVGDSRTYLMRAGELVLLTRDDSLVQSLLDNGRITAAEAATHPHRSMVTRALVGDSLDPTLAVLNTRPGDRFLLCSDGLTDLVQEPELVTALRVPGRDEAADLLVRLALEAGGNDNVSVVVADVVAADVAVDHSDGGGELRTAGAGNSVHLAGGLPSGADDGTAPARPRRWSPARVPAVVAGVVACGVTAAYLLVRGTGG